MLVTLAITAPVFAVLWWLFIHLRPQGLDRARALRCEWLVLILTVALAVAGAAWIYTMDFSGAGPIWQPVLAALVVYGVMLAGLGIGFVWRLKQKS